MKKIVKSIVKGFKEEIKNRALSGLELEQELLSYMLRLGRQSLERLQAEVDQSLENETCRTCGQRTEDKGLHRKEYRTRFGFIEMKRRGRYCGTCQQTEYALDQFLGVDGAEGETAAFKEWVCFHTQLSGSFTDTVVRLKHDYGIAIEESQVSRILDKVNGHTGPPDLQSRKPLLNPQRVYTGMDGILIRSREEGQTWHEVKNAVVFTTVAEVSEDRIQLLDKSYVSTAGELEDFQRRLQDECASRQVFAAREIVLLGDGAPFIKAVAGSGQLGWIEKFGSERQTVTKILDPHHRLEKFQQRFRQMFARRDKAEQYTSECFEQLWEATDETAYQEVIAKIKATRPRAAAAQEAKQKLLEYLQRNRSWIVPYKKYREAGYIVSAGFAESAHHTLVANCAEGRKAV